MGVLAMKPFAGGMLDDGPLALRYIRQFEGLMVLPGLDSIAYVDQVVDLFEKGGAYSVEDEVKAGEYRAELGNRFCRRCGYCQPCPNGVNITYAMMYRVVAKRMSRPWP
jgi:predicted aldo/keto reductase-like oxidoreductase